MNETLEQDATPVRLMPPNHWNWHVKTPFSQGWKVGDLVFVGGQLSCDSEGNVLGVGDIEAQTRNVYANIARVLQEAGCTWKDVIKLNTYYVCDGTAEEIQSFWEKMTRVRLEFITEPGPASTAVRVSGLMYDGFLIEAEAVAVVRQAV